MTREFTVTAKADVPEDAIAAIQTVMEDIATVGYTSGFPTTATWKRQTRSGIDVYATWREAND